MTGAKTDNLKGRLKEAGGVLSGDEKLKHEGQLDQAAADVKETVEKTVDKVKGILGGSKKG